MLIVRLVKMFGLVLGSSILCSSVWCFVFRLCVEVSRCGLSVFMLCMVLSRIGNSVLVKVMKIIEVFDEGNIRIVRGI